MDQILILHAPDAHAAANKLVHELDLLGFISISFGSITRNCSRSEITAARPELFDGAPAIILLGSPQLFEDPYYLETAKFALPTKVVVFLLYDQGGLSHPDWFENPIVLKSPKIEPEKEWNKLIQCLLYLTGPF